MVGKVPWRQTMQASVDEHSQLEVDAFRRCGLHHGLGSQRTDKIFLKTRQQNRILKQFHDKKKNLILRLRYC